MMWSWNEIKFFAHKTELKEFFVIIGIIGHFDEIAVNFNAVGFWRKDREDQNLVLGTYYFTVWAYARKIQDLENNFTWISNRKRLNKNWWIQTFREQKGLNLGPRP